MTNFAKNNEMDSKLSTRLGELKMGLDRLASQRNDALRRAEKAEAEIVDLKSRIKELDSQLQKSELDKAYLSLSHKLADNPDTLEQSRRMIREMIKKVDRALSLLKNDAEI